MATIQQLVEKGLAKPARFEDIENYDYKGVPPKKCSWSSVGWSVFEVYCPLSLFQQHIEHIFSNIEGLHYSWDPAKCVWHIEYGTRPIEHGKPGLEYMQIMTGKNVALDAANLAFEKFPQNIQLEDILFGENTQLHMNGPGRWCKMELRIYNDKQKNCLFIHLNRQTGDHASHWYVWREIYPYFNENKLFLSRSSYIGFMEGTSVDTDCPVQRFLFDELVAKDICTFMVYE